MEADFRLQYNGNGEPIKFWIVGPLHKVSFLLDFLKKRFLEIEENKEKNQMKGIIRLGTKKAYLMEIKHLSSEEWDLVDKISIQADLVAFYQPGDVTESPHEDDYNLLPTWGEVKGLVYLEASVCSGWCEMLNSRLPDDVAEQRLRGFFKGAQFIKVKRQI